MAYKITEAERKSFITIEDFSGEIVQNAGPNGKQAQLKLYNGTNVMVDALLPLYNLQYGEFDSQLSLADQIGPNGYIYSQVSGIGWRYSIHGEIDDQNYLTVLGFKNENNLNYDTISLEKFASLKTRNFEVSGPSYLSGLLMVNGDITVTKPDGVIDTFKITAQQGSIQQINSTFIDNTAKINSSIAEFNNLTVKQTASIHDVDIDFAEIDVVDAIDVSVSNILNVGPINILAQAQKINGLTMLQNGDDTCATPKVYVDQVADSKASQAKAEAITYTDTVASQLQLEMDQKDSGIFNQAEARAIQLDNTVKSESVNRDNALEQLINQVSGLLNGNTPANTVSGKVVTLANKLYDAAYQAQTKSTIDEKLNTLINALVQTIASEI